MITLLSLIILAIPAYFANAIPVVLGGGTPIDNGRNFIDGKRLFGDSKTIRGFIAGMMGGFVIGSIMGLLLFSTEYNFFDSIIFYPICGFLMGFGTMTGDLIGSFLKRRAGMKEGSPALLLDEITFIFFAIAFILPFASHLAFQFAVLDVALLVVLTFVLHKISNVFANKIGIKKVPW